MFLPHAHHLLWTHAAVHDDNEEVREWFGRMHAETKFTNLSNRLEKLSSKESPRRAAT
jgi:hypothetical protein